MVKTVTSEKSEASSSSDKKNEVKITNTVMQLPSTSSASASALGQPVVTSYTATGKHYFFFYFCSIHAEHMVLLK